MSVPGKSNGLGATETEEKESKTIYCLCGRHCLIGTSNEWERIETAWGKGSSQANTHGRYRGEHGSEATHRLLWRSSKKGGEILISNTSKRREQLRDETNGMGKNGICFDFHERVLVTGFQHGEGGRVVREKNNQDKKRHRMLNLLNHREKHPRLTGTGGRWD